MNKKVINTALSLGLFLLLFIPMGINHSRLFKPLTVYGVESEVKNDTVSWWDGSAQKQFDENLMASSIARSYFIRIRNQYQYSLFHKINAKDIYEYNDLFFRFYSFTFNEEHNFIGEEKVKEKVRLLKRIQDELGDETPIITVIAPSKMQYYKDRLPAKHRTNSLQTNYVYFLKELKKNKLDVVDFNRFFLDNRSTTPAVFGSGGIHWSEHACATAMDSLVKFVSHRKGVEFARFDIEPWFNNGFSEQDLDISLMLNRIVKPKDNNLRAVKLSPIPNQRKIKAVIITDSFCFTIFTTGAGDLIFTPDTYFHYYFGSTYTGKWATVNWENSQLSEDLAGADCVIILTDIVNMENFGFGFIEEAVKKN